MGRIIIMRYVDRYLRLSIWPDGSETPLTFGVDWKITFRVRKNAASDFLSFNQAEISVYNMAPAVREKLSREGKKVSLVAGYKSHNGSIFEGVLNNCTITKQGTDITTTFYCSSGSSGFDKGVEACLQNVSVTDFLRQILDKNGLQYILPFTRKDIISKSYSGTLGEVLAIICGEYNISCGIDNGVLIFADNTKTAGQVSEAETMTFTPNTGLLGNPTQTFQGMNIRALINPDMKINNYFTLYAPYADYNLGDLSVNPELVLGNKNNIPARIDTTTYNGTYMALSIVITGDTRGNAWYMDIEGSSIV